MMCFFLNQAAAYRSITTIFFCCTFALMLGSLLQGQYYNSGFANDTYCILTKWRETKYHLLSFHLLVIMKKRKDISHVTLHGGVLSLPILSCIYVVSQLIPLPVAILRNVLFLISSFSQGLVAVTWRDCRKYLRNGQDNVSFKVWDIYYWCFK